jgi:DNA-binding NarL/FixJ family response regulator
MEATDKIRVVLVDDHAILREGLKALLALSGDVEVVAEAGEGETAIGAVLRHEPDVVVMDMAMPGMGGIEATRRIARLGLSTRVLILSQYDNERYVLPVLQAGAFGYLAKKAVGEELLSAIRMVYHGQPYLGPAVEKMMLRDYQQRVEPYGESDDDGYGLTERQREILQLVAQGHTSEEIADMLHLSPKTVMSHRANIYSRLGTSNLAEIIKVAIRLGLVEL